MESTLARLKISASWWLVVGLYACLFSASGSVGSRCFSVFCLLSCVVDLLLEMLCVLLVVVGCGCFKRWGYGLCFVGMGMSIPVTNLWK